MPGWTARSTPSTASVFPNRLTRPTASTASVMACVPQGRGSASQPNLPGRPERRAGPAGRSPLPEQDLRPCCWSAARSIVAAKLRRSGDIHASSCLPRTGRQGLGGRAEARGDRRHGRHREGRRHDDLRYRPAHPQGRCPGRHRRADPGPRGGRHRRDGRQRGQDGQGRGPRPRLVHLRLRDLPVLPGRACRAVPRRGRLDPRPQDRRDPGRIRPGSLRRHLHLPPPGRGGRRGHPDAVGHPADRLRGRRAQRPRPAGRCGRDRRGRPDRPVRDHRRPPVQPQPHRRDRPGGQPPGGGEDVRRRHHREQRPCRTRSR